MHKENKWVFLLLSILILNIYPLKINAREYGKEKYNLGAYSAPLPSNSPKTYGSFIQKIILPSVKVTPKIEEKNNKNIVATSKTNTKNKILKLKSTGKEVKNLQIYLNKKGYKIGIADGKFGEKTKKALIQFQKANKLTPDGVLGPKTRALIEKKTKL